MPLFGPPNIEKMKAKRDVKGLVAALGYQKEPAIRRAAAAALSEIKDVRAVEPLIALLQDQDVNLQDKAAEALGNLGDPRAVEPLIAVYKNRRHQSSSYPAIQDALEKMLLPTTAVLEKILDQDDSEIRIFAGKTLFELGSCIQDKAIRDAFDETRYTVLKKIVQSKPKDVEILIAIFRDDKIKPESFRFYIDNLHKIGRPVCEMLGTVFKDGNLDIRKDVTNKLLLMEDQGRDYLIDVGQPAVESLIAAFCWYWAYSNWAIAGHAAIALGRIGDVRAIDPLSAVLNEKFGPYGNVRVSPDEYICDVVTALGMFGDKRSIAALIEKLNKGFYSDSITIRHAVMDALIKIGKPAVNLLIDSADNAGAADVLVKIGSSYQEMLIEALKNKSIRKQVAGVLDKINWKPGQDENGAWYYIARRHYEECIIIGEAAVEPLLSLLQDSDDVELRFVVDTLGKIGDVRAAEPLLRLFRKNENKDVRKRTVTVLISMGWKPQPEDEKIIKRTEDEDRKEQEQWIKRQEQWEKEQEQLIKEQEQKRKEQLALEILREKGKLRKGEKFSILKSDSVSATIEVITEADQYYPRFSRTYRVEFSGEIMEVGGYTTPLDKDNPYW